MIIAYKNIIRNTAQTSINRMYSKIVRNDNEFCFIAYGSNVL